MTAFVFSSLLIFFSILADLFLLKSGLYFNLSAMTVFYFGVSRNWRMTVFFPLLGGLFFDVALGRSLPLLLLSLYFILIFSWLWLNYGEFSKSFLPQGVVLSFISMPIILLPYLAGLVSGNFEFNFYFFSRLFANLAVVLLFTVAFFPFVIKYSDILSRKLGLHGYMIAQRNLIKKRQSGQ